jgi:pSer/pThr/pTyr-binding forkhead associated (FHA) protein
VSARHCQFDREGEGWTVIDLGSKNGTFVNGRRVSDPTPVRRGDVVQFGPAAVYRCA